MTTNTPSNKKGLFIVFEGGEGSGKTTQARMLADALEKVGVLTHLTREPGDTDLGRELRKILLDPTHDPISKKAEALLFAADRAEHVEKVIIPKLDAGCVVICDRYIASTIAYQVYGGGLSESFIEKVCGWSSDYVVPDVTYLMDVDPGIGLERAKLVESNRFEEKDLEYHDRVRQGFLEQQAVSWLRMDARLSPFELGRSIFLHAAGVCTSMGLLSEDWDTLSAMPAPLGVPDLRCPQCNLILLMNKACPDRHGWLYQTDNGDVWEAMSTFSTYNTLSMP